MKNSVDYNNLFTKSIIKHGRWTNLLSIPLCFLPAILIWLYYGIFPGTTNILRGWFLIASIYAIYAVVEPISYFPVLGLPGTYMSFLSGNIGNMRVPCAAIAQEAVGVKPGTKQAEIVSTLGIAGSIITNLIIVTVAAVGGAALMSIFPPAFLQAFQYVSPAIFGAIFALYASKNIKYGIFAMTVTLFMLIIIKVLPTYVMIPVSVFSTVIYGFWDHQKDKSR